MGFPRQEYWSGLPFLLLEMFPTQGLNPGLLQCRQTLYRLSYRGSPRGGKLLSQVGGSNIELFSSLMSRVEGWVFST